MENKLESWLLPVKKKGTQDMVHLMKKRVIGFGWSIT
jgi:hypothetical protein